MLTLEDWIKISQFIRFDVTKVRGPSYVKLSKLWNFALNPSMSLPRLKFALFRNININIFTSKISYNRYLSWEFPSKYVLQLIFFLVMDKKIKEPKKRNLSGGAHSFPHLLQVADVKTRTKTWFSIFINGPKLFIPQAV